MEVKSITWRLVSSALGCEREGWSSTPWYVVGSIRRAARCSMSPTRRWRPRAAAAIGGSRTCRSWPPASVMVLRAASSLMASSAPRV